MDLVIKNMNIPESCANCILIGLSDVIGCKHEFDLPNEWVGRAPDCQLNELPDHGDFDDAQTIIPAERS